MRKFPDLTPIEAAEVYPPIVKNGEVIASSAALLAKAGNYGNASSLLVLSLEELLKASLLFFHSIGVSVFSVKELKEATYKHDKKHELGQLYSMVEVFIVKQNESHPKKNFLNTAFSFIERGLATVNLWQWLDKADDLKKRGLYADYNDGLKLPADITEQDYLEAKRQFDLLKTKIDNIKTYYDQLTLKQQKNFVEDLNQALIVKEQNKK